MPAQSTPNLQNLLRILHAATDKKSLHWNTTADEDTFRAVLGFGMVRISRVTEGDSSRYLLSLLDNEGVLLEEYNSFGDDQMKAIDTLYKNARNQALNIDRKLQGFFDHLKKLAGEP